MRIPRDQREQRGSGHAGSYRARTAGTLIAAALLLVAVPGAAVGAGAAYGPPQRIGTITSPTLSEVSGMVAAHGRAGAWWAVNDSGNPARLHAFDSGGRLLATIQVSGASNRDWEDLAAGPARGKGRALYFADIGDNEGLRNDLVVYRVPEPAFGARETAQAERFPFRYPDGRHNSEAIVVDPGRGGIYVLTKATRTGLYRFPLPLRAGTRVTLERVRLAAPVAASSFVTGAAASPDGTRVAIRTYWDAYELRRPRGTPFERIFRAPPERVRLAVERQGEAIAYTPGGRALVTTSEEPPAPIWRLLRTG